MRYSLLAAYARSLRQYWQNPKGRHDLADFAVAFAVIAAVTVSFIIVYEFLSGRL